LSIGGPSNWRREKERQATIYRKRVTSWKGKECQPEPVQKPEVTSNYRAGFKTDAILFSPYWEFPITDIWH
jgi:hypothetical protein